MKAYGTSSVRVVSSTGKILFEGSNYGDDDIQVTLEDDPYVGVLVKADSYGCRYTVYIDRIWSE